MTVGDKNIYEVTTLAVRDALEFFSNLTLTEKEQSIAREILKEIKARLSFLVNVGLDYLTLDRAAATLSGGEAQRIRLATQIGSSLMGVLYILDEPSIGLHQRDNERLGDVENLRDLGIRLPWWSTMKRPSGLPIMLSTSTRCRRPRREIVAAGTLEDIMNCPRSITGQYLSGKKYIPCPPGEAKMRRQIHRGSGSQGTQSQESRRQISLWGVFIAVTGCVPVSERAPW